MAESSMRKIDRINEDRISELPLNIQEIILCFLRIQDATCIWSIYNMRILELVYVTSDFGQSIYHCPVLEKLTLIFCTTLFPINFSAPNLKCLHHIYDEKNFEYGLPRLHNLKEFSLPHQCLIVCALCVQLVLKYLAAGGSPNRLSKPLPYLKTLNMCDLNFSHLSEVSCVLCLIRSAPIILKLPHSVVSGGLKAELELIKFLLGHSPLLKRMSIHRSPKIKKDVAFALGGEILQYSRASSRVQIRELKDPVIIDGYDDVECDDIIH
ncbi:hypothetical protein POM88_048852 [Heracleum sosnowskyi]|uniref:FBD domain-containing protein n=1 Tax=Heracleum sosnowskyi TaxID=360622 RepID=A0AAD8GVY7_9APIA|nr:hypothetical protein POM88_048852 [Heracleum sosnowskyi]